ncbi:hypothetical protein GCM10009120_44270 [Sphingobacterium siyangense subsp. cladoniae]|uniref:hypothetical protein n=1 Tax=Sphingobacterium siyangense TaxID=459529 RepID=UPI0031F94C1E
MTIEEQKIYTPLFFNNPTETLNIINSLGQFVHQKDYIELDNEGGMMEYPVPFVINKSKLSKIMDVDKYKAALKEGYDSQTEIDGIECIELYKLALDFDIQHRVKLKVDHNPRSIVYCSDKEYTDLYIFSLDHDLDYWLISPPNHPSWLMEMTKLRHGLGRFGKVDVLWIHNDEIHFRITDGFSNNVSNVAALLKALAAQPHNNISTCIINEDMCAMTLTKLKNK